MLAPNIINSREIEETTSVATVIPNKWNFIFQLWSWHKNNLWVLYTFFSRETAADDDEQLRLALEISNLQMEQEALKEAIFLRLLNQQQRVKRSRDGPKLRHRNSKRNSDCPRNRDPQTTGLNSANDVPYVVCLFGTFISFLRAIILCLFTILPIVYVLFVAFSIAISNWISFLVVLISKGISNQTRNDLTMPLASSLAHCKSHAISPAIVILKETWTCQRGDIFFVEIAIGTL